MKKKVSSFLIFCAAALLVNVKSNAQGMAINTAGTAADNSAMLDVSSTTKGILIPRMTITERNAISSPVAGLLIYQTNSTPGFYYYNGSTWTAVSGGSPTGGAGGGLSGTYPNPSIASDAVNSSNIVNGSIVNADIADGTINVAKLATTGTPSGTTFLNGNGAWATPAGGGGSSGTGASPSNIPYILTGNVTVVSATPYYSPIANTGQINLSGNGSATTVILPTDCTPSLKIFSFAGAAITWKMYTVTPSTSGIAFTVGSEIATCSTAAASGTTPQTCTMTAPSQTAGTIITFSSGNTSAPQYVFYKSFSCD